jgi:hypothetical protein
MWVSQRKKKGPVLLDLIPAWWVYAEATTKSKLASLNEKLDVLERKLEVLEVQVSSATTNPSVFN